MEKKLYRETNDRVLGGVAAGLARYFEIDVTWVRILFILAAIFGFSGFFIYLILWIAIPEKPFNWTANTSYKVEDINPLEDITTPKMSKSRPIGGFILIFLGLFFLLHEFDIVPYWFSLGKLWPLVFIIPGLVMLVNSGKNGGDKTNKPEDSENSSIH